jgi:uncharacterized membrane protein YfcA
MVTEIVLLLVGIVVGVMNSVAGGGILLGFPVLLAAGLTPLVANVTSNLVVLPGQLSSIYGYRSYLRKLPARYLLLIIPCFIGGIIGALLLRYTSDRRFEELIPVLIFSAVLLFAFQPFIHLHLHRHITKRRQDLQSLALIGIALLPTAVYGGYFGAGFGFIMLAFLGFTSLHDIHQMNGLKNIAGTTIAVSALIVLYSTGMVNWRHGLPMAIGTGIGGYVGAKSSLRFSTHAIRIVVIVVGLVSALYLALHTPATI